jgi:CRISPR-associated protein Csx16
MSESANRTRTRLVSFLGIGRYERTRHLLADGTQGPETEYICRALAEWKQVDEIAILATTEAQKAHAEKISTELRNNNLPAPEFHPIPIGKSEPELWQQFAVVKELLRPRTGTEIVFDITHAFRSQPFFAAGAVAFIRAVDRKSAPVQIFYAAFEARQDTLTPVWDLTPFIDLIGWAQEIMMFMRTGRSADVAKRTEELGRELRKEWAKNRDGDPPNLQKLGNALREFGGNLETIRTGDLLLPGFAGSADRLAAAIEEARQSVSTVPPLADVLDRLRDDLVNPLLGASAHLANDEGHRALTGLARLYRDMGRWAEAAAIIREGWITRYATPAAALVERNLDNAKRPGLDETARRHAEARWSEEEGKVAKTIAGVRNDIEHAGFKRQPGSPESLRSQICDLIDRFAALPGTASPTNAAGHPPVFINISNHPSERWSSVQREAALRFAPEIRDFPFPSVPPEAEADDIAVLADQIIDKAIKTAPGMTHAMVQGEFTLAHALVHRLQRRGVVCFSATTKREVVEDGNTKTTRFGFVRFREYQ